MLPPEPPPVQAAFDTLPAAARGVLRDVRALVFDVARSLPHVGHLREELKWGQPSYRPDRDRVGSPFRLGVIEGANGALRPAVFFHCQTDLVERFRREHPGHFEFEGNRALVLGAKGEMPEESLRECVAAALTYHLSSRRG